MARTPLVRSVPRLLSRKGFREAVLERDKNTCVNCGAKNTPLDAHHIIERRLFADGGYYLENGASLCDDLGCHRLAEQTLLTTDFLRERCGITNIILPDHLYADATYTKWGDMVLESGRRLPGELFWDESVQAVLAEGRVLDLYDTRVRYPRTFHLPYSPGMNDSDRALKDVSCFDAKDVVVTLKMDGENTTMYRDGIHARSVEGTSHPSQAYVRNLQAKIASYIPLGARLIVENLYAVHSIAYTDLENYVYVIGYWNERNICASWDQTREIAEIIELPIVEEIYRGPFDQLTIAQAFAPYSASHEGFVVRDSGEFPASAFRTSVAKWVRKNHVQPNHHNWRTGWYESESSVNKRMAKAT